MFFPHYWAYEDLVYEDVSGVQLLLLGQFSGLGTCRAEERPATMDPTTAKICCLCDVMNYGQSVQGLGVWV